MSKKQTSSMKPEEIEKIKLEHDAYLMLMQTIVYVFVAVVIFLLGYAQGSGSSWKDLTMYVSFAGAVIIIILIIFSWKNQNIRNNLKGQAVPSFAGLIVILGILLIFLSISYGGFDNLWKQITNKPYIKSVNTIDNSFYFGQTFYMDFIVANPQNSNFIPEFSVDYDLNCINSSVKPNIDFYYFPPSGIYTIGPNARGFFALNFTVVDNGCQSDSSTIGLYLYYFNTTKPIDYKSFSFNIIRTFPDSTTI